MRRGSRSQSAEPDSDQASGRPSSIRSSRRMSLRMPSFKKGSKDNQEEEIAPPVPAVPDRTKSYSKRNISASPAAAAPIATSTSPVANDSPRMRSYAQTNGNGTAATNGASSASPAGYPSSEKKEAAVSPPASQEETKQNGASNGILGGATALVAGTAAAAGGAVAAITGLGGAKTEGTNGKAGYDSDEDSDEFHDAELADIAEGSEDEDETPHTRHRGMSDGAVMGAGAIRSSSPEPSLTTATTNDSGSRATSQIGSTASYKRRSGSVPTGSADTSTPSDNKAKKETPQHVREKAARVAKLGFDDFKQTSEEMTEDIGVARKALHLFLNSHMIEAERIIEVHADKRMYYALGWGLIATIKGFMVSDPKIRKKQGQEGCCVRL